MNPFWAASHGVMRAAGPVMRMRRPLLGLCAALGFAMHVLAPSPPERSLGDLVAALGAGVGGVVRTSDLVWEPSPGMIAEMLWGRPVLFLASARPGEPRDLYRAHVRLSPEGRPLALSSLRNLTATPFGDDFALVAHGGRAAFATSSFGKVASVSMLGLAAESAESLGARGESGPGWPERVMRLVTSWQETGSLSGTKRADILIDATVKDVRLSFFAETLVARFDGARSLSLDDRAASIAGDVDALGARLLEPPALYKRPILWAVDTVRAEVGPEPIAWLEQEVFSLRDWLRRARYGLLGPASPTLAGDGTAAGDPAARSSAPGTAGALGSRGPGGEAGSLGAQPTVGAGADAEQSAVDADDGFPPRAIPSIWKNPEPSEGQWQAVSYPWLRKPRAFADIPEAPPYFFRTTIRPDPERPYDKVLVVAMDMRQLELDMQAGVEDPKPLTGPPGAGRIPRDPNVMGRVVAAFNGAFKTLHGAYGMVVHRRVLLPPVARAATVVVTEQGRVGLGTWGDVTTIPDEVVSLRQNLEPLIEDGKIEPSGRRQWGWQLDGTSMMTERSGLCIDRAGTLFYVWGDEVSAITLGKAMVQTGCTYGIHLDMNPHHTGFVFAGVRDYAARDYNVRLLTPEMEIMAERYLEYSPKDFFYVMLRDHGPPSRGAATDTPGSGFTPDLGGQPPPAWSPAIWHALVPTAAGVQVELFLFEAGRLAFKIEPSARERVKGETSVVEALGGKMDSVLATVGMGSPRDTRGGDPRRADRAFAYLNIDAEGAMRLSTEGDGVETDSRTRVRLPLVLAHGEVLAVASEEGLMRRRGVLGTNLRGQVVLAIATALSEAPLAAALTRAGCDIAVALDRGDHAPTFVHRAGTDSHPLARYEQAALYAVSQPMRPGAFRWNAAPPTTP